MSRSHTALFALLPLLALALPSAALAATNGKATASSVKTDTDDPKVKYTADKAVDGLLTQGWAEGASGYGAGSWLELDLGQTIEVKEVNLWGGNLSEGKKSFREYSRPKKVKLTLSGGPGGPVEAELLILDQMQRYDHVLETAVMARKVRVEVLEVYEGFVFADLYMAEVAVNFRRSRSELEAYIKWLEGPEATKLSEKHEQSIKDAYAKIKAAEFGDRDAMDFIMDEAADGADWVKPKVLQLVDVGFRAAAIRPDDTALDALRKLKDPNGIAAIEMAMLRSYGKAQEELEEIVEIFYAYSELIGGPDLSVPNWGQKGWSPGQLQSFGEPVPIEINLNGDLYVADIGNNRVQRFTYEGKVDAQWGGDKADITDAWFTEGRTWYVSGAASGDESGRFINPLDVELIPMGKDQGEAFAVLDTTKRVQVFDAEGRPMIGWTVQNTNTINSGVGGEGYLAWVPKKQRLYVVLGNEMIAYTLDAQEVGRWRIEDGTPNAMEVAKNGKLYMAFGRDIVMYDVDGFRHGVIWSTDQLGLGYEDLDITIDDQKRIWIVTDQGWAFKYKTPKKLEYKVKMSDLSLVRPRIAAQDDILYCVDRDRIIRLDAMQAYLDAQAEEAERAAEAAEAAEAP